ncbi:ribonuclease III [Candidatus Parcubacteria bacterium]|nr:MAG: ribonuclease III [Candidatus Parcubacteria bacterium]
MATDCNVKNLSQLEEILNLKFKNQNLLRQALVHRSYLNENPGSFSEHNERLEFLGDAVLELVVTDHLYKTYQKPEGELTALRASLVNANALSDVAKNIGLNDFLLLSRGEQKDIGKARQYILANAVEAVIGALYIDQGYDSVKKFVSDKILKILPLIIDKKLYRDAKSLFQEESQGRVGITPTYEVLKEWGPDHAKHFTVGVFLGEELVAEGEGTSKQEAQQAAAEEGLKAKGWNSF